MRLEKINLKRTCSFYISDFHLSTLLLPYITEKTKKDIQIVTFLEKSIEENVNKLLKGINIEEYVKSEIRKINWKETEIIKCAKKLKNMPVDNMDINIIVAGKKEYIENINANIEKFVEILNAKGLKYKITLTINNCYPVSEVLNVKEVLDDHDMLLNTSGEVEIDSVFQDYIKVGSA